jgi:hypothetical protein
MTQEELKAQCMMCDRKVRGLKFWCPWLMGALTVCVIVPTVLTVVGVNMPKWYYYQAAAGAVPLPSYIGMILAFAALLLCMRISVWHYRMYALMWKLFELQDQPQDESAAQ